MTNPNNELSSNSYARMLKLFSPRIIKNAEELERIEDIISFIVNIIIDEADLTPDEADFLSLLGLLVKDYEDRTCVGVDEDIYGPELLKHLMEMNNLTQADLNDVFKTQSILSAVLKGAGNLTVEHICKLAVRFNIEPAIFLPKLITLKAGNEQQP